jgi:hypothetical protein
MLSAAELDGARTILLLVIDGLGLDYLRRRGRGGALLRHLRGELTSVFPSTTASAITTLLTGLAPQQHGLTGWHMYFSEIDRIAAVLPLQLRAGEPVATAPGELPRRLFGHRPLSAWMGRAACMVTPADIAGSAFNRYHAAGASSFGYGSLDEMCGRIVQLATQDGGPRFVFAYYPVLDAVAHRCGVASGQVAAVFAALDAAFGRLLDALAGSATTVIATADHGFIDAPAKRLIELERHPALAACLARPLCGERRVAYCYLEPGRAAAFEDYVGRELADAATAWRGAELIAQGWFGPGPAHPRLAQRIGDYVLVMKEDWTIKDWLPGERRHEQIGVHGGISEREMRVPLILAQR